MWGFSFSNFYSKRVIDETPEFHFLNHLTAGVAELKEAPFCRKTSNASTSKLEADNIPDTNNFHGQISGHDSLEDNRMYHEKSKISRTGKTTDIPKVAKNKRKYAFIPPSEADSNLTVSPDRISCKLVKHELGAIPHSPVNSVNLQPQNKFTDSVCDRFS